MTSGATDFWTDDTSVLFTSFYGWTPEEWGAVGWTTRGRRDNLLKQLTDPFVCVVYVAGTARDDPDREMLAGFFLVSHETGDRDDFTDPSHHDRNPDKWRHSLRALRAFTYLPEYRIRAKDMFPELSEPGPARAVATHGEIITDSAKIGELRNLPWIEVRVYSSQMNEDGALTPADLLAGMVSAGPASGGGYQVPEGTRNLPRELYVLRLTGDADSYLGRSADGASIYKVGLSASPELRRQSLQKSMPKGAFKWKTARTTRKDGHVPYSGFPVAVAGEAAVKTHLAHHAEWLGGEFYLASDDAIEAAWRKGRRAALDHENRESDHADR